MNQKTYDYLKCEGDFIDRKLELKIISDILHCRSADVFNFREDIDYVLAGWIDAARKGLESVFDTMFEMAKIAQEYLNREADRERLNQD